MAKTSSNEEKKELGNKVIDKKSKKQIIPEPARNLKEKIPNYIICIEIVNQSRLKAMLHKINCVIIQRDMRSV